MDDLVKALNAQKYIDGQRSIANLKVLIGSLFVMRGEEVEEANVSIISDVLDNIIRQRYAGFTFEEIRIALTYGILGQYGEYFGINVISLANFLKSYKTSDARFNAINLAKPTKLLSAPGPEYNKESTQRMYDSTFEYYCQHGALPNSLNAGLIISHLIQQNKISKKTYDRYTSSAKANTEDIATSAKRITSAYRKLLTDYFNHIKIGK